MGYKLMQKSKPLRCQLSGENGYAGNISARPVEARDEPETNRIVAAHYDNRNSTGRRLGRGDRRTIGEDCCYPTIDQVGSECWQAIIIIVGPAIFDSDVAALVITGHMQALTGGRRHSRVPL